MKPKPTIKKKSESLYSASYSKDGKLYEVEAATMEEAIKLWYKEFKRLCGG